MQKWNTFLQNKVLPKTQVQLFLKNVNQDKSATRFCCQVAAWVPDMFFKIYFVKNCKIDHNSATTKTREK